MLFSLHKLSFALMLKGYKVNVRCFPAAGNYFCFLCCHFLLQSFKTFYFILYSFWYTAKFYVCDIVGGVLPVFALFDICPTCEVSKMYLTSQ